MKLSIVIPIYNEEKTVTQILDYVLKVKLIADIEKELVIVDDCSKDRTPEMVRACMESHPEAEIRYLRQEVNQGKGAAVNRGVHNATGDFIIIQDADLEYDPEEYNLLLPPLLNNRADVVYGSRYLGGRPHKVMFFWHSIGNRWLTRLSNLFNNLNLTDMETCYKLFRADIIKRIDLKEKRFGFEPEITAKLAKMKDVRICEVPISYYGRRFSEGKKIGWRDGFHAIHCIIKYKLLKR